MQFALVCLSDPQSDSYMGHSLWKEKDDSAVSFLVKILDVGYEFRYWFHPSLLCNDPEPSFLISLEV